MGVLSGGIFMADVCVCVCVCLCVCVSVGVRAWTACIMLRTNQITDTYCGLCECRTSLSLSPFSTVPHACSVTTTCNPPRRARADLEPPTMRSRGTSSHHVSSTAPCLFPAVGQTSPPRKLFRVPPGGCVGDLSRI
mgnify:CR=1 FL=1